MALVSIWNFWNFPLIHPFFKSIYGRLNYWFQFFTLLWYNYVHNFTFLSLFEQNILLCLGDLRLGHWHTCFDEGNVKGGHKCACMGWLASYILVIHYESNILQLPAGSNGGGAVREMRSKSGLNRWIVKRSADATQAQQNHSQL